MEVSILILADAFVRLCDLLTDFIPGQHSIPVGDILINRQGSMVD